MLNHKTSSLTSDPPCVHGVIVLPRTHSLGAIGEFADAAEVIPCVEGDRSIGVHEALAVELLLNDAAGGVPFFRDLHTVPEVFLVAGDLESLISVRVLLDDLYTTT